MSQDSTSGHVRKGRAMSAKLAERAAMFGERSPASSSAHTERKKVEVSGGSVKDRLAALQQPLQHRPSRPLSDTSPMTSGGGVKEKLAALGGGLPIAVGPPRTRDRPASTSIAARMAANSTAGAFDMKQLAARIGASMPEPPNQEVKKPALEELAIQRPTLAAGSRRKKTMKKIAHEAALVQPIGGDVKKVDAVRPPNAPPDEQPSRRAADEGTQT